MAELGFYILRFPQLLGLGEFKGNPREMCWWKTINRNHEAPGAGNS